MPLITILLRSDFSKVNSVLLLAVISGTANVLLLITVCDALRNIAETNRVFYIFIIFLTSCILLWVSQRILMGIFTSRFTDAIDSLRLSILRRVFSADHLEVSEIGSHHISVILSRTFDIILESAPAIVICTHCGVEIILGFAYLFLESSASVAVAIPFIGIGAAIIVTTGLRLNNLRAKLQMANAALEENSLLITNGLREARVNSWRAFRVYNGFLDRVRDVRNQRIKTNDMFIMNFAFAELVYFAIGGAVIFILPSLVTISQIDLFFVVNSASFMAYPALLIALFSLSLVDASGAAQEVVNIEATLPNREWIVSAPPVSSELIGFSQLSLRDACFEYNNGDKTKSFTVGPINLDIKSGSIVFVTGLNGTGKSTLLHMLLALYPLSSGAILLDGKVISGKNLQKYYRLFSIDFPDCHLTDTILGVREVDEALGKELLDIFEMSDKVTICNGKFSTIALSHGQRKRLSLIASLLEKRPILVLDEWAADQSPAFRSTFYKKILPWVKSNGITVIAITHDDAYFDVADLQIELENGRTREVNTKSRQTAQEQF